MKKLLILGLLLALGTTVLFGQVDTCSLSKLKEEAKAEAKVLFTHVDSVWNNWGIYRNKLVPKHKIHILSTMDDKTEYRVAHDGKLYDLNKDGNYSFRKPDMSNLSEEEAIKEALKIIKGTQAVILKVIKDEEEAANQEKYDDF